MNVTFQIYIKKSNFELTFNTLLNMIETGVLFVVLMLQYTINISSPSKNKELHCITKDRLAELAIL